MFRLVFKFLNLNKKPNKNGRKCIFMLSLLMISVFYLKLLLFYIFHV